MTRVPCSSRFSIAARISCVVKGSAAARSMRTPRERSAAVGLGPRTTTVLFSSKARNRAVTPRPSVALNRARVPTPAWNPASLAASDVGHLAEELLAAHHVEQAPLARHLRLAAREEEEAGALLLLLDDRPGLRHARPLAGARQLPEFRIRERSEHRHALQHDVFLAVGYRARRQHALPDLGELEGEVRPGRIALRGRLHHGAQHHGI